MATTASFTRQVVGYDVVFVVNRARFPLSSLLFAVFAFFLGATIPVVNLVLMVVLVYRISKMMSDRKPFPIVVGPQALRFQSLSIPLEDVADLSVVGPDGVTVASSSVTFIGAGPVGLAMAATGAIAHASSRAFVHGIAFLANRAAARQIELRVRRRSHSRPVSIVGSLTSEAAAALLGDLTEEIQQRLRASRAWQDVMAMPMVPGHHPGPASLRAPSHAYHPVPPAAIHHPYEAYLAQVGQQAVGASMPAPSPVALPGQTMVAVARDAPASDGRTICVSSTGVTLRFINGPLAGRVVPVGSSTIIGREAAVANLVIPHPQVSSAHAWIGVDGPSIVFRDRGSTNGSAINGTPVLAGQEIHIGRGDTVSLGGDAGVSFVVEQ